MKHIFKRALALTMIAVLFAVSAFAAPTFSNVAYDKTSGNLTVNVDGYTGGKDATILVLKAGVTPANATNNDIVFIDQVTVDAGKTVADYVAPIKVRAAAVGAEGVNVWVGGDEITTAVPYTKAGETGATEISLNDEPVPADTYTVEIPAGTYKTTDEAKVAAVVKKNGAVITTGFEIELVATATANVYTVNVKVDSKVVASTTVTITPDVTPGGKTGITGVVKRRAMGKNYSVAPAALVMVTNGATIVGTAVTDADGKFDVEVPAGTYRVIVRFTLLSATGFTNYGNTVLTDVAVTDGAMATITSADQEFIAVERRVAGDANDDGVVNTADLTAVKAGLQ
ncbi:MAG: hypothetical protein L6V93_18755 [Clostridiales bacterium]|nr:MAG: hypothetical protein L6V93_18755 [Clostridiales bacterium]